MLYSFAGAATAEITVLILATNETRLMQEFVVSLLAVEPANVASINSDFARKRFLVPDVGNPGGTFSFSPDMNSTYTIRVTTLSHRSQQVHCVQPQPSRRADHNV